jgi:TP901 family phage tail tape measure protein
MADRQRDARGRYTASKDKVYGVELRVKDMATKQWNHFSRSVQTGGRGIMRTLTAIKRVASVALGPLKAIFSFRGLLTAAVGGSIFGVAIRQAAAFQKGLFEVGTIAGLTRDELAALGESVKQVAIATGQSFADTLRAAYNAVSAGVDPTQVEGFLQAAGEFAVAGVTDINTSVDLLTSVLNAYGKEISEATEVSDTLFKTVELGKTTVTELAATIGKVAPTAKQAGVEIEEVGAALAAMTASGLSTQEAGTGLTALMLSFVKPTAEASEKARELGVELSASAIETKGFTRALLDVTEAAENDVEVLAQLFPNIRALRSASVLAAQDGQVFTGMMAEMGEKAGSTTDAFNLMASTFDFKWSQFKTTVNDLMVTLGDQFLPIVIEVLDKVRTYFEDNRVRIIAGLQTIPIIFNKVVESVRTAMSGDTKMATTVSKWFNKIGDLLLDIYTETMKLMVKLTIETAKVIWDPLLISAGIVFTKIGSKLGFALLDGMKGSIKWFSKVLPDQLEQQLTASLDAGMLGFKVAANVAIDNQLQEMGEEAILAFGHGVENKIPEMKEDFDEFIAGLKLSFSDGIGADPDMLAGLDSIAQEYGRILEEVQARIGGISGGPEDPSKVVIPGVGDPDEVIADLHRVSEETKNILREIALLRASEGERTAIALQFMYEDDVAQWELALEEKKIAQEDFDQWLLLRQARLAEDLKKQGTGEGSFSDGITDGIKEIGEQWGTTYDIAKEGTIDLVNTMTTGFGEAFGAWITGTKDSEYAWKQFVAGILSSIAQVMAKLVAMKIAKAILGGATDGEGAASGAIWRGGFQAFARGTPRVTQPTLGLVGEGPMPEAIVPLPDGRRIPVQMIGGGGSTVVQHNHFHGLGDQQFEAMLISKSKIVGQATAQAMNESVAVRRAIRS